jgi:hypothetical protein
MESIITDYEPVKNYDRITGERTAASFIRPEVWMCKAATGARGRTARLVKSHGFEATHEQFLRDVQATGQAIAELAADIQRWADRGWLGDMRKTIERRTARNEHHLAQLKAAAEVLIPDRIHKARSPGMLADA